MKRMTIAALMLGVVALILVGCGGSSSSSSSTTTGKTASSSGAKAATEGKGGPGGNFEISAEAKACLKEKGVELPEFKGGEGGPPSGGEGAPPNGSIEGGPPGGFGGAHSEETKKALEECGVELPEFKGGPGAAGGKPGVSSAAFRKQVKEYVACVRENGFELAEPDFSGEGPIFEKAESESAAFKQASANCQGLLGGPQTTTRSQAG